MERLLIDAFNVPGRNNFNINQPPGAIPLPGIANLLQHLQASQYQEGDFLLR